MFIGILINNLLFPLYWGLKRLLPKRFRLLLELFKATVCYYSGDAMGTGVYLAAFSTKLVARPVDVDNALARASESSIANIAFALVRGNLIKAGLAIITAIVMYLGKKEAQNVVQMVKEHRKEKTSQKLKGKKIASQHISSASPGVLVSGG